MTTLRDKLFAGKIFYLTPSVRPSMAVIHHQYLLVTITKIFQISFTSKIQKIFKVLLNS